MRITGLSRGGASDGPSDGDLLTRLNAGEAHALRVLYQRYARPAYSVASRICRNQGLAEDVVQEVFVILWREPSRYTPARGSFPGWLLTVVRHKAVDVVRRENAACRRTVSSSFDSEDWLLPPGPGADEAALKSVYAHQVRAALRRLPPQQRQILLLSYYGGYTQREISESLGVPLGTVKSRMAHGVRRLRIVLSPLLDTTPQRDDHRQYDRARA